MMERELKIFVVRLLFIVCLSVFCLTALLHKPVHKLSSRGKLLQIEKWKQSSGVRLPYTDFQSSLGRHGARFWHSIKPGFQCPRKRLRKVGDVGQAGHWMCGVDTLAKLEQEDGDPEPCTVYSSGSGQNSFFEVELLALTQCRVHAYEPSAAVVDHPLRYFEDRVNLVSAKLGGEDRGNVRTLKTLMKSNGGQQWVDVVKMNVGPGEDIRELETILEDFWDAETLPVGQLLVRLRVEDWGDKEEEGESVGKRIVDVFEALESKGMRLFHREASHYEAEKVADFGFINGGSLSKFLEGEDLKKFITL